MSRKSLIKSSKMQDILIKEMASTGFLKSYGIFSTQTDNFAQIQLGKNYNFSIYSSLALDEWNYIKEVKGNGTLNNYSLLTTNSNGFQIIVNGNSNDHNIINSNFGITKNIQSEELIIGAKNSWDNTEGGDGIFIFEIPIEESESNLYDVKFEFTARRENGFPAQYYGMLIYMCLEFIITLIHSQHTLITLKMIVI